MAAIMGTATTPFRTVLQDKGFYLAAGLCSRPAYVHVVEGATGGARDYLPFDYDALHDKFDGVWMVNNGYDLAMARDAIDERLADLVSFGRDYIANPDLVRRLREGEPLNVALDPSIFYGGGAHGYTDYPTVDGEIG